MAALESLIFQFSFCLATAAETCEQRATESHGCESILPQAAIAAKHHARAPADATTIRAKRQQPDKNEDGGQDNPKLRAKRD
tara:strand:+ start:142 stop:387 length:246 start_codon:yes stop_codon:yes gene_type:complete